MGGLALVVYRGDDVQGIAYNERKYAGYGSKADSQEEASPG